MLAGRPFTKYFSIEKDLNQVATIAIRSNKLSTILCLCQCYCASWISLAVIATFICFSELTLNCEANTMIGWSANKKIMRCKEPRIMTNNIASKTWLNFSRKRPSERRSNIVKVRPAKRSAKRKPHRHEFREWIGRRSSFSMKNAVDVRRVVRAQVRQR